MASVVASSAVFAPYAFAAATPSSAPETYSTQSFVGLKSAGVFAGKSASLRSKLKAMSNGSRVQCMQVWSPINNLKFETLSYLPPLTSDQISKQIDYMLANKWIPCLEFHPVGVIFRKYHKSPGYYDGRYWTMWKLPMFGCTDSALVLQEIELVKEEYPNCYVRVLGFDNTRQVQCVSFIVHKPSSPPPTQLGRQVRSREGPAVVPAAQQSVNLPPIAQLPLSAPVFRPPASSLIATDLTLDWDSLDIVGKYAEQLVYPRRPEPNPPPQAGSSREERWLRMQAAASELSGLSRVIATNTVAHELYIQELEDTISLLRLISTRHKAYIQSAAEQSSSAVNIPKHTSQPPTDLDRQVRPREGPSAVPAPQQSVDLPPIATPSTSSSVAVIPIQDGVEGEEESTGSVNTTAVGEDEVLQGTEVGVTGKVPDPQGQILDFERVDVDPPAPLAELEPGSWTVLDHYVLMVGGALALLPMAMLLHLVTADLWPHWRHELVNVVGTFGSADH